VSFAFLESKLDDAMNNTLFVVSFGSSGKHLLHFNLFALFEEGLARECQEGRDGNRDDDLDWRRWKK